ncbi:MAG: hypothetical protein IJJ82_07655 [Clostridia bacterium]|nr:hypothetical protein [Clostridia bacterium]
MDKYIYLFLGVIFGLAVAIYYMVRREEKIEKTIKVNQKVFSTEKLDKTMETVVERIENKINDVKRELTEDEKNEIIVECYKEEFKV